MELDSRSLVNNARERAYPSLSLFLSRLNKTDRCAQVSFREIIFRETAFNSFNLRHQHPKLQPATITGTPNNALSA